MTGTTLFFIALSLGTLPSGPKNEPWSTSAKGDDGRVGVTVSAYRDTVAPGEVARISAIHKVLVDGPLRFPQSGYHQPLAFLYLRTPAGKVIVYPQRGVSPKSSRALESKDYKRFFLFKKGIGGPVIAYDIPMVNPAPEWLDPITYKPVRPNLRKEGVYQAWVKFTIPKVDGVPADAWHGTVETERIRFKVREIPVADRRAEATAEQIAHLEAYMKKIDALSAGKDVETDLPKAAEMPSWMSLDDRLQWAWERTENEGFARYTVAVLLKPQPKDEKQAYPKWWSNVDFYLRRRAQGRTGLKIVGPYLDDYATVAANEIERELAGRAPSSFTSGGHLNLLLAFVAYKPESPIRKRLEKLARQHAKIPVGAKPGNRKTRARLDIAWRTLYALGILRDGMKYTDAKEILGEPPWRKDGLVLWNYGTGSRRMEPGVNGKIVDVDGRQTIVFLRRDLWRRR